MPHSSHRFYLLLSLLACGALQAAEGEWQPVWAATRDGSRLLGRLRSEGRGRLRGESGAREFEWSQVVRLDVGERIDPRLEEQARDAVRDLGSDQFDVRKAANDRLRALGRAGARPLKAGTLSTDAEVAARSRELVALLASTGAVETTDRVVLADGQVLSGALEAGSLDLATRWGFLRFPLAALEGVEAVRAGTPLPDPPTPNAVPIPARALAPDLGGDLAVRWDPRDGFEDLVPAGAGGVGLQELLQHLRVATFDQTPEKKAPVQNGDSVEDLYAPWGLLLRGDTPGLTVRADITERVFGLSQGLAASACADGQAGNGGVEASFVLPGSYDLKTRAGRPGGIHEFGVLIGKADAGTVQLAAYDHAGRLLLQVFNRQDGNVAAGGALASEFLGFRSRVPVARVRLLVVPGHPETTLRVDDLAFDRVGPADHDDRFAAVFLRDGGRLIGTPLAGPAGAVTLAPSFLPEGASASLAWDELARFEPPRLESGGPAASAAPRRRGSGAHGVLLQNGESFRGLLDKLDAQTAVFLLPGGVRLALPRGALRKVDLAPPAIQAGEAPAPVAVTADEKPGVDFRKKRDGEAPGAQGAAPAPPKAEPEKPAAPNPAQGLPRMDNAEIVSVDLESGELVVDPKDGGGAWPIDLSVAGSLVFPPAAVPAGGAPPRAWVLVLRQGSRFAADLKSIGPAALNVEIAGGLAEFPHGVVESIERKTAADK